MPSLVWVKGPQCWATEQGFRQHLSTATSRCLNLKTLQHVHSILFVLLSGGSLATRWTWAARFLACQIKKIVKEILN